MAKALLLSPQTLLKPTAYLFFLAIILGCAHSTRILDEVPATIAANPATTTLPSGQIPSTASVAVVYDDDTTDDPPPPALPVANVAAPISVPVATSPSVTAPIAATSSASTAATPADDVDVEAPETAPTVPAVANVAPISAPITTSPGVPAPIATTSAAVATEQHPTLSFFMHDILGGSHPSARVVTGIIANSGLNGIPFSKPGNNIFPLNNGVPLQNIDDNNINAIFNNGNNLPFLTGLNGGGNNQPFVTAGQLPAGATLQKLVFGAVTVIDDELTLGHELGSAVIGKAQGLYLASSLDGTSQTMAVTAIFHGGEHGHEEMEDTVSLFGVHRTASMESEIAVVGGTGKYENARGYAVLETLHQEDQHTTDGVDTVLQFSVYLAI